MKEPMEKTVEELNREMEKAMSTEPRPKWQHRQGDRYTPALSQVVTRPEGDFALSWISPGGLHSTVRGAIREGFRWLGSDDFNVLVLRKGKLVACLWMEEDMEEPPEVLDEIAGDLALDRPVAP